MGNPSQFAWTLSDGGFWEITLNKTEVWASTVQRDCNNCIFKYGSPRFQRNGNELDSQLMDSV